jgi:hypothetical protein
MMRMTRRKCKTYARANVSQILILALVLSLTAIIIIWSQKEESKTESDDEYQYQLTEKWATPNDLKIPESVLFDNSRNVLYVSNINGRPSEKNGNGFISKVTLAGEIENLKWITGLNAPKGMGIWQNNLYVSDIDELVEIDIEAGEILNKYQTEDAIFLNDVTVDDTGNVYVSDMSTQNSVIYIFFDGKLEVWFQSEQISSPNGLFFEDGRLIVGTNDGYLKDMDLVDKSITTIAETGFGIDGIQGVDGENFIVSDWEGKTAFVSSTGYVTVLINTAESNINSADIEYIPENRLLLIPTFYDNRVMAYEFT